MQKYLKKGSFGMELVVDLTKCDLTKISSKEYIRSFVVKLCDETIEMKRFGKPLIPNFGHENKITSGFSLVQLIETSSVVAHFSDFKKTAYINIFSCKWFDTKKTAKFCKEWFGAKQMKSKVLMRN